VINPVWRYLPYPAPPVRSPRRGCCVGHRCVGRGSVRGERSWRIRQRTRSGEPRHARARTLERGRRVVGAAHVPGAAVRRRRRVHDRPQFPGSRHGVHDGFEWRVRGIDDGRAHVACRHARVRCHAPDDQVVDQNARVAGHVHRAERQRLGPPSDRDRGPGSHHHVRQRRYSQQGDARGRGHAVNPSGLRWSATRALLPAVSLHAGNHPQELLNVRWPLLYPTATSLVPRRSSTAWLA
jgi:hypothetical protein